MRGIRALIDRRKGVLGEIVDFPDDLRLSLGNPIQGSTLDLYSESHVGVVSACVFTSRGPLPGGEECS